MNKINLKRRFFLFLRVLIFKILYKINYRLTKCIDEKILINFLYSLRPYQTNHELIRLGEAADGGYLLPNDLIGIEACITAGVGDLIGFEHDLAKKGIDCYMADYSVEKPPINHEKFKFEKKFIGSENNDTYIKVGDWLSKITKPSKDYILKIDIESEEYKILPLIKTDDLKKMRIILLEIHDFTNIITSFGYDLIKLIFDKLQENHTIVHINPNNVTPPIKLSKKIELYDTLEITLLRNDRIIQKKENITFPHYLDAKHNNIYKSELPKCFYKKD
jgi:hypothetical protein